MSQFISTSSILDSIEKNLPLGIIILSSKREIVHINAYAMNIFQANGVTPSNLDELLAEKPNLLEKIHLFLKNNGDQQGQMIFTTSISDTAHEIRIERYKEIEGDTNGVLLQFFDISRLQQAESTLESTKESVAALLDTLNDYYFEIDIRGVVTNINQAFCQQLGYSRKEEVIGKHLRHFTDRDSVRLVYQNYLKVFEQRETVSLFQYTYHTRDGRAYIGETTVSPIIEGERVVGARGLLRDVTARVRVEESLHKTSEDLQARVNELAVINRISVLMNESLHLKQVLHTLCEEFTRIFPVRNAGIGIITADHASLEVVAFHSDIEEEESLEGMLLPLEGSTAFAEVVEKKKAIWIEDAGTDPRMGSVAEVAAQRGTKSLMIAPLLSRGTAIGTIFLPGKNPEHIFTEKEQELAGTIAIQIATAIDNAQLYTKAETDLDIVQRDLQIGKAIQSGFFPETIPAIPGWEISTHFEPARYVSGDFYDIFPLGGSKYTAIIIADVCDKGVGAALFMVLFRSLFRAFSRNFDPTCDLGESVLEMVRNTNAYVAGVHGSASMFATAFVGIINAEDGRIHYVNGGHEPPVILTRDGSIRKRLGPTGPAIGLFENAQYESKNIHLEPGDFLVGYTDGTLDAENSKGTPYSETRFLEYIQAPWTSLFSMVYELNKEIKIHAGDKKQFDDITLLAVRRKENPAIERHGICRVVENNILNDVEDFCHAAGETGILQHSEADILGEGLRITCGKLVRRLDQETKKSCISLFIETSAERASAILRDDGLAYDVDFINEVSHELETIGIGGEKSHEKKRIDIQHTIFDSRGNQIRLDLIREKANWIRS